MAQRLFALFLLLMTPGIATAQDALSDRRETFGASLGPAVLPSGAMATHVYLGVPEAGAGYRQGFDRFELEGRIRANWIALSATAEVVAKALVFRHGGFELGPLFGLGLTADSGARYIDPENFTFLAVRVLGGAGASYRLTETLQAFLLAELPVDITVWDAGGFRFTPLIGGGVELYLGNDFTGAILGQVGVDVLKEPTRLVDSRLGFHVRLALGHRMF